MSSLKYQLSRRLSKMMRIGQSKHDDKISGVDITAGIYSYSTYRTYMKHGLYFLQWCKKEHGCRTLEECAAYREKWLQHEIADGKSPYTIKLELAAVNKIYYPDKLEIKTPPRQRRNIQRSRGSVRRDANFNEEKHTEFVAVCRGLGLRRHELEALTAADIIDEPTRFGVIVRRGKGGKYREVTYYPDKALSREEQIAEFVLVRDTLLRAAASRGKLFPTVSSDADIHGYRADYAKRVYRYHARPIETLTHDEIYFCRGDKKGIRYDKKAMAITSKMLGHNRISVIASHYLNDINT